LKAGRHELDEVVNAFGDLSARDVEGWTRPQQIAFWVLQSIAPSWASSPRSARLRRRSSQGGGTATVGFLSCDWSLNDLSTR
jgi:hypothetical protein